MKCKLFLILMMLLIVLTSCYRNNYDSESLPIKSNDNLRQETELVNQETEEIFSETISLNNYVESTSVENDYRCIEKQSKSVDNIDLPGKLVFTKIDMPENNNYYYDGNLKTIFVFTTQEEKAYDYKISPDGKSIAYYSDRDILVIEDVSGEFISDFDINSISSEPNELVGWLNNEVILIWFISDDSDEMDYLVSINPVTREIDRISTNFPSVVLDWMIWRNYSWKTVFVFDPTMQYVVYINDDNEQGYSSPPRLVLRNIHEDNNIGVIEQFGLTSIMPLWKNNSTGFYFNKAQFSTDIKSRKDEWYFMDITGKTHQLTKYNNLFDYVYIYNAFLSPDENKLAYLVSTNDMNSDPVFSQLQILDLQQRIVNNYCITADNSTKLVWSPDSNFLSFGQKEENESISMFVLDIVNNQLMKLVENAKPDFWISKEME